ncbi:hypothetical protein [Paenibacillus soyae]|uniref:MotA/TolQ/ExbB proton channel domain-containing protein n=1 Tax=Paenibacillus soyae TaxID=2969249 RepID=A0A9X2MWG2_9BACL|nr:hypothetical protein [Paenibacillus soyae]MCR2807720.1 hypothetical protein [Paenibacillus soyae]
MGFMSIFTSGYFFAAYIAGMIAFGTYQYFRIYPKYAKAKQEAAVTAAKLEELKQVDDLVERFNQMDDWVKKQQSSEFVTQCIEPSWRMFYKKFMDYQRSGVSVTPDVYDYFHEESFVQKYGSRKLAELVPGLFLAIGIFGTFLGIATGVSGLDPNGDSAAMKSGIGILLSGMTVKFLSSMSGIALSGIWQYIDKKKFLPSLQDSFHVIRQSMDEAFPTQEESTVLFRMLQNQEKHMQDFQVFMSEHLIPQMMTGFTEALNQSILPPLEQTQTLMGELVTNASANQMDGVKQLTAEVMSSLNEITGEHMKNLGDALQSTVEWQQRVHEQMSALVESMQQSAIHQSEMVEKTTVLTGEIHNYTENITDYQQVLEGTVAQLNDTTAKNSELQVAVTGLLDRMIEERNVFHNHFEDHIGRLQLNVETIVAQSQLQADIQRHLEQNLGSMTGMADSQQMVAAALADQAVLAKQSGVELEKLVVRFENNASLFTELQARVGELLELTMKERERVDELVEQIQEDMVGQVEAMDERVQVMTSVWEENSDIMTKMNKQLGTSMNQFTDDMHRGIMRTFEQFDEELTKSVNLLAKGVDAMRDGLVELPEIIQELKQSVTEINKQAKRAASNM